MRALREDHKWGFKNVGKSKPRGQRGKKNKARNIQKKTTTPCKFLAEFEKSVYKIDDRGTVGGNGGIYIFVN